MAIAFVSSGSGSGSTGSTTLALSAINLASGNFVFAAFKCEGSGGPLASVADTAGNTYSLLTSNNYSSDANLRGAYAMNCASHATNVVTGTFTSSATWRQGGCLQFSGVATTGALDQQAYATSAGSTSPASGAVTTTQADEVCCGFTGSYATETFSAPLVNGVAATARYAGSDFYLWDRIVSATFSSGTASCTKTTTAAWACGIATFKAAAAAADQAHRLMLTGVGF